jgi:hypothetical protein
MASPAGKIATNDIWKTVRDAAIVAIAALLAWAIETWVPGLEKEGVLPAATVILITTILSATRRWMVDTRLEHTKSDV